jgi:hypothetical protein
MPVHRTSTCIDAPPQIVWPVLANVTLWPQWTPTVSAVDPLDGPDLQVGRRYRLTQPKLRPATWTVTDVLVNGGFTWESRSPGMTMVAKHVIEPSGIKQTHVTLTFEFRGVLGALLGRLSKALVESYLTTEASSLRTHIERAGIPDPGSS